MSAYIIARVNVTNSDQYQKYTKVTPDLIEKFGGRFIVRGGEIETLEGPTETGRLVLVEFPSYERAKAFYTSEEYSEAKQLREGAAHTQFLLVDGISD